jgi:5-methylcytosine-specific restriction protein B
MEQKIEELEKLYDEFLNVFPIEKLKDMKLNEYTNLKKTSFCYWVESKTTDLGSIWGGSSYKFGIYHFRNLPKDEKKMQHEGNYAWYRKYQKDTPEEAFKIVREKIVAIAINANAGSWEAIDKDTSFGTVYKWKIAFLYSHRKLVPFFKKDYLVEVAKYLGEKEAKGLSIPELQKYIMSKLGNEDPISFYVHWNERAKKQQETNKVYTTQALDDYVSLLKNNKNLILTGAPGTGKTYLAKQIAAKMIGCKLEDVTNCDQFGFVQFHPSYDYTDFVEGLRPNDAGGFDRQDGIFKQFCKRVLNSNKTEIVMANKGKPGATEPVSPNRPYIFIIDEINRGELSRIFGELFFSLDPGYRGTIGRVKTQYQSMLEEGDVFYKGFYVPKNVYVIGTMNDIDRSVESMDFAMRRRFAWKEVSAEDSMVILDSSGIEDSIKSELKERMQKLNDAIEQEPSLGHDYQLGGAYFLKYLLYKDSDDAFENLWNNHIEGLLKEYLRGVPHASGIIEKFKQVYDNDSE